MRESFIYEQSPLDYDELIERLFCYKMPFGSQQNKPTSTKRSSWLLYSWQFFNLLFLAQWYRLVFTLSTCPNFREHYSLLRVDVEKDLEGGKISSATHFQGDGREGLFGDSAVALQF